MIEKMLTDSVIYPPAPWEIHGQGLMIFRFPRARTPDTGWPDELPVQSVALGRTMAGYYIAEYDTPLGVTGTTPWYEWGNIMAFARQPKGNGFWMSCMAVDLAEAIAGGEEIWGLNKVSGKINWKTLKHGGRADLQLSEGRIELMWREWGPSFGMTPEFWFFTRIGGLIQRYSVTLRARFQLSRAEIKRRDLTAFPSLSYGNYWAVRFRDADIRISAPIPQTD